VGCAADSRGAPEAGHRDFPATVSKYVVRHRKPPSRTWRTFLDNHLRSLVSVDFFSVPTVTFKVLFVFVVLAPQETRRACQRSRRPHGPVDGPGDRRGVPLGHRTALLAAR
jgi:hypothetical protein